LGSGGPSEQKNIAYVYIFMILGAVEVKKRVTGRLGIDLH
tara:strand:- start:6 stop:125 length:120 start_codon:yes stop_codon:yes gene_type:complete